MDLNQLYSDHQMSVMLAAASKDDETRFAHEEDAFGTFQIIARRLDHFGGTATLQWQAGVPNMASVSPVEAVAP